MGNIKSGNLGYPRIGGQREWKKQIEAYWAGKITEQELHEGLAGIRLGNLRCQRDRGIDVIPVGDFTYYDHVLDTATMFGLVPERFAWNGDKVSLDLYYAIARGNDQAAASEMTKWFNTNYHYIVPELGTRDPRLTVNRPLMAYLEAKQELGIEGRPVLLGLFTLLKLSKGETAHEVDAWIEKLLPLYVQVLRELEAVGAAWVQLDEPALVIQLTDEDVRRLGHIYRTIAREVPGLRILMQTYFDAAERYEALVELPIHGLGLDFVHGAGRQPGSVAALWLSCRQDAGGGTDRRAEYLARGFGRGAEPAERDTRFSRRTRVDRTAFLQLAARPGICGGRGAAGAGAPRSVGFCRAEAGGTDELVRGRERGWARAGAVRGEPPCPGRARRRSCP
ncbi:hypothetical protein HMSSN139_50630 [Paenibacillus sp. HMSSN-139]|nr:hypothetical protein HMSSN139_50630 [Paenibacillus sp. HMSSN-139]